MSSQKVLSGGCACGAIRYETTDAPILAVNCHCRQCQRASGSAYAPVLVVWKESLKMLSGQPSLYSPFPDNPFYLQRGFCSTCGSPVLMYRPERPRLAYILVGSLDSPGEYKPAMNIFTDEAHSWDLMDEKLDRFPGMPPVPDDLGR